MRRATRTAESSPSIANATPASEGRDPRTNVIMGCTDATAAPRLRKTSSSSLASAPLECSATSPFQFRARPVLVLAFFADPGCDAKAPADRRISESGTQNQITSVRTPSSDPATARAPTFRASLRARFSEVKRSRAITASIAYPACRSDTANALPKFPAPTIATRGLRNMSGSIADG